MTSITWDNGQMRNRVKEFGYRHAFTLILLAVWGILVWIGEVMIRYVI